MLCQFISTQVLKVHPVYSPRITLYLAVLTLLPYCTFQLVPSHLRIDAIMSFILSLSYYSLSYPIIENRALCGASLLLVSEIIL